MTTAVALLTLGQQPTVRLGLGEPLTPHGVLVRNAIVRAEDQLERLAYENHDAIAGLLRATREIVTGELRALHEGACELEVLAEQATKDHDQADAIIAAFWQLSHDRELARALWLSYRLRCATWGAR